jgi:predicted aspartyl protease
VTGHVNILSEAVLPLRVFGPLGESFVTAVIDTGYTASLTLPAQTIAKLGLVSVSEGNAFLADGSNIEYHVYAAEVDWDGVRQRVSVFGIGGDALVGMAMLKWHRLRIDLSPGGVVEVTPL